MSSPTHSSQISSRSSQQIFEDARESFTSPEQASVHSAARSSLHLPEGTQGVHLVGGVEYHHANEAALHHKLATLFEKHIDGENSADFHQLIESRARELHSMGETPESVEATLSKGTQFNRAAMVGRGAVRAVPFAAASLAFDNFPVLSSFASHAALLGMDAGLQSAIADTFGCALLDRMSEDSLWMHAKPEELEPVMQQAAEAKKPSELRLAGEYAAAIQPYTVRNMVRLGTAAAVTAWKGPEVAASVDSKLTAAGGLAAGGAFGLGSYEIDRHKGRTGPEYLFGRGDWKAQYASLKSATVLSGPVLGAVKRTAKLPLDVITDTPRALRALASAGGIGKSVALSAGFGGVTWARSAVSAAMGSGSYSAASIAAMSHLTNVVGSLPVYAAVPATEILGDTVGDKITDALQTRLPRALGGAADWAARQAQQHLNSKLIKTS